MKDDSIEHDIDSILDAVAEQRRRRFDEDDDLESGNFPGTTATDFGLETTPSGMGDKQKESKSSFMQHDHDSLMEAKGLKSAYRMYQFWTGRNTFCFEGRFFNGLKRSSAYRKTSICIVLLSFAIYMTFPAFHLYQKISPYLTLLTVYMFVVTLFFYILTYTYNMTNMQK